MGLKICKERAEQIRGMIKDFQALGREEGKPLSAYPRLVRVARETARMDALIHQREMANSGHFRLGGGPAVENKNIQ